MSSGETARLVELAEEAMALCKPGETIKQAVERRAKEMMEASHGKAVPSDTKMYPCHWCDGVMRETPTKGRLECQNCGSVSLCGRQEAILHVGKQG